MKALRGYLKTMLALMLLLSLTAAVPVLASDAIDFSKTGEISVTIKDSSTQKAVGGGSLTMYKVADVAWDDTVGYVFDASGTAFKSAGGDYSSDESLDAALAAKLADYAKSNGISGTTLSIGSNGVASASDLDLGLYLIVQNKAAKGYGSIKPFLVSVPQRDKDGNYIYKVDATPKPGTKINPSMTPTPTPTRKPTSTPTPTPPERIPQTGQLWWPVFALAVAGVISMVIGMAVRRKS